MRCTALLTLVVGVDGICGLAAGNGFSCTRGYCAGRAGASFVQGLKPLLEFRAFAARLKSCPDTSCFSKGFLAQTLKSWPDTKPLCVIRGKSFAAVGEVAA